MTRIGAPSSARSSSSTDTAPGWPTLFAMYPSRRNRPRAPESTVSSLCSHLRATRLPLRWDAS